MFFQVIYISVIALLYRKADVSNIEQCYMHFGYSYYSIRTLASLVYLPFIENRDNFLLFLLSYSAEVFSKAESRIFQPFKVKRSRFSMEK